MNDNNLIKRVENICSIHGEFVLRSGLTTDIYFDKYRFMTDPYLLEDLVNELAMILPENTEALAGLEMGGIPLATMLSHVTKLPMLMIRKEAKTYGTCQYLEGDLTNIKKVVLIEDIITTGGAIRDAYKKLLKDGIVVQGVRSVIDRGIHSNILEIDGNQVDYASVFVYTNNNLVWSNT